MYNKSINLETSTTSTDIPIHLLYSICTDIIIKLLAYKEKLLYKCKYICYRETISTLIYVHYLQSVGTNGKDIIMSYYTNNQNINFHVI